jgi:putative endonuclease
MLSESLVTWRKRLAVSGEAAAADYCISQGYLLQSRNWRHGRLGEIDLILSDASGTLIFAEVKTRRLSAGQVGFIDAGFESVNWRKRQKIVTCARAYMSKYADSTAACRFDVLVVYYLLNSRAMVNEPLPEPIITHIRAAF